MLSIKQCKQIFKKHNENYTDKEIESILKLLKLFAEIDVKLKKQNNYER